MLPEVGPARNRGVGCASPLTAFCFAAVYTTAFWGEAARYLPWPVGDWYDLPYRLLGRFWHSAMPAALGDDVQLALFQVVEGLLLGFALPLLGLRASGYGWREAGLGVPARHGAFTTCAGMMLAIPAGYLLVAFTAIPPQSMLADALLYLLVPPEHFLVFGALLLPGRGVSPATGTRLCRFAMIAGTTIIFALLHVGAADSLVFWSSIPLGAVFAVMTFVSASIWPAVAAHVALNLVPVLFPVMN